MRAACPWATVPSTVTAKSRTLRAAAAAAVALAVGAAAWWGLGAWARSAAEAALAARLSPAHVTVGAATVLPGGVRLGDVAVRSEPRGVRLSVRQVDVEGSPLAVARGGVAEIDAVRVEGVRGELDLRRFERGAAAEPPLDEGAPPARRPPAAWPALHVADVDLLVQDAHGELAHLRRAALERSATGWRLAADTVSLGGDRGERATAREVVVEAGGTPVALRRAEAAGLDVVVDATPDDVASRLRDRLVAAVERVVPRREEDSAPAAAPSEPETSVTRGQADTARTATDEARPGAAAAASPRAVEDSLDAAGDTTREAAEAPLRRWLGPDAQVRIVEGTVHELREGEEAPLLTSLSVELARTPEGGLRTRGQGETSASGALRWSFELADARARPAGELELDALPLSLVAAALPDLPLGDTTDTRVDAELTLSPTSETGPVDVSGRLAVTGLTLASETLSARPIRDVAFEVEGRGTFEPEGWGLALDRATIRLRDAEMTLSGRIGLPGDDVLVDVTGTLPPTPCDVAVHAIPPDVLGDYVGFSFDGSLAGRVRLLADTRAPDRTELEVDVADGCRFESVPAAADLRRFRGPFVHRVREPDGQWFEMTTGPGTGNWVSIWRTSPYMIHALLGHEDGGFFRHHGFATWAIRGALERNLRAGRVVWGGSTITMQLAKNLFLARERTLVRKVQEVLLTWWLESSLDKLELLELYFNVIEYGPGVYGLRNAAWHYFRRHPEELSPAESAYLACILPAPKRYQRSYARGALTPPLRDRMARHLRHLHDRGRIDDEALRYGLEELDGFAFADPEDERRAPPRLLPDGAAPVPGLGRVTPGGDRGGWSGSPLDLDRPADAG